MQLNVYIQFVIINIYIYIYIKYRSLHLVRPQIRQIHAPVNVYVLYDIFDYKNDDNELFISFLKLSKSNNYA